jgi:hypothetical protein
MIVRSTTCWRDFTCETGTFASWNYYRQEKGYVEKKTKHARAVTLPLIRETFTEEGHQPRTLAVPLRDQDMLMTVPSRVECR